MNGLAVRLLPYLLAFFSSFCIMILELVASRLVARHVGASLTVWTSVIGIMLGGICLGNVLGGRLADRVEPRRAIGPLYALGAFLTLSCLWINVFIGLLPGLDSMAWNLRTVVVVTLDFLIPATVLGMIGPVVAKMAVEQATHSGSAIGFVYFLGAVGSIVGTFLAGFVLMYLAPVTAIVTLVAAALSVLGAFMIGGWFGLAVGLAAAGCLALGAAPSAIPGLQNLPGTVAIRTMRLNSVELVGHVLTLVMAILAIVKLVKARSETSIEMSEVELAGDKGPKVSLRDLAVLSFVASLAFMALEMVAGRLVSRHLGSSIYGWTSVIGVLLGGLSLGNFLGGFLANLIKSEKQASWLFLIASMLTLGVIYLDNPPTRIAEYLIGSDKSVLSHAITWSKLSLPGFEPIHMEWPFRVLLVTIFVFFLPALAMGTFSPVVAKLAVERVRRSKRTGTAIGQVYAWGMVGSILGTFLAGFVLIDFLGTKGLLLVLATALAFSATALGSIWHAIWAGLPLGLCAIAFIPLPLLQKQAFTLKVREEFANPTTTDDAIAWIDESDYYFIKVTNEPDSEGQKRTLVLDNLIHGYFILGHPDRLDYDYEHIYGLVAYRVAAEKAKAAGASNASQAPLKTLFLGGGAYTFQRYMQHKYPLTEVDVAEIDTAVNRANQIALGLIPFDLPSYDLLTKSKQGGRPDHPEEGAYIEEKLIEIKKDTDDGKGEIIKETHPIVVISAAGQNLDVGRQDMPQTKAEYEALQRSSFPTIQTYFGDARQFVERNQGKKQYDIVFGDAFNDFSVPWHLTTREFNDKIANLMSPDGVYMINIIDAYESDATIEEKILKRFDNEKVTSDVSKEAIRRNEYARGREYGGFLGAWVKTAKLTFPHVYIFGTDDTPGSGLRETFVVVASKKPLAITDLGAHDDDPQFFQKDKLFEPRPFPEKDVAAVDSRARGITLTDDYAPVENLLAPIAKTRGDD
jgi:spermidine synthase